MINMNKSFAVPLYPVGRVNVADKYGDIVATFSDEFTRDIFIKSANQTCPIEKLRDAIQLCEEFGLVRTEDGSVITGAIRSEHGVVLVKE